MKADNKLDENNMILSTNHERFFKTKYITQNRKILNPVKTVYLIIFSSLNRAFRLLIVAPSLH